MVLPKKKIKWYQQILVNKILIKHFFLRMLIKHLVKQTHQIINKTRTG